MDIELIARRLYLNLVSQGDEILFTGASFIEARLYPFTKKVELSKEDRNSIMELVMARLSLDYNIEVLTNNKSFDLIVYRANYKGTKYVPYIPKPRGFPKGHKRFKG